jgi:hypothetical protein
MPDKRSHRGQHPSDGKLFSDKAVADIRRAVADFSLLLTKGYADKSALKLVGDRFVLTQRQRTAVMRCSCSNQQLNKRKAGCVRIEQAKEQTLAIDGYNLLITIEAAISGGLILAGRDGCFRDLASIHGTYRKVTETIPAINLIGDYLRQLESQKVIWFLDSPVSNSGKLKKLITELAGKNNWNWEVQLVVSPDAELKKSQHIVISSDSVVLDSCNKWINLAAEIIKQRLPQVNVIDLAISGN